jgi:COMM domain containing 2
VEIIQQCVEGLAFLFGEAAKRALPEVDFVDSVMLLNFPASTQSQLKDLYLEHRKEIRAILEDLSCQLPHYKNLRWRLDVKVRPEFSTLFSGCVCSSSPLFRVMAVLV